MEIKISVIVPIYNVEQYVKRCLESVIAQANADVNIECVIVNDCTKDNSMTIVNQLISDYKGPIDFKVISHDKNLGLSATRNTGVINSMGNYIFFMDSDDYLLPNSFLYFVEYLKMHPNVDMIIGNVNACKGGDLLIRNIDKPLLMDDCNVFFRKMLHHQIYLYAWNKLIRRNVLMDYSIHFEEGILFEDQCWTYELFSHLSSILILPKVTYVYENNPFSIVNTAFTPERGELVLKSYTISINKMLDNPPCPERYKLNMTVDYLLFMMNFLMNGVDVHLRCPISDETLTNFRKVKRRIVCRSLSYGRLLLSCFFLLLFSPFCYIQKLRIFRCHYYDIESVVNTVCHLMDFLHRKNRI